MTLKPLVVLAALAAATVAHAQQPTKFTMQTNWLAIGVRKDEPKLLAWINDWVKTNLKNGKLAAIYKQYHGVDIPTDELLAKTGS